MMEQPLSNGAAREDSRREQDIVAELGAHREAIRGHCYRMLGSGTDADDAVQETLLRGWKAIDSFDGRASLRTWLYRIATNVCLDALARATKRERPVGCGPAGTVHDELVSRPRTHWLEPVPDADITPPDADPHERAVLRESVHLAFVAALQHLPPRQRAALLLKEVLGQSAQDVATTLEMTVPAVNSALQRARATLAVHEADPARLVHPEPLAPAQRELLDRYVDAFHRYDVAALQSLMREDAVLSMPPYTLWLQGPDAIGTWFLGRGVGCRGSRLVSVQACGSPAFAQYRAGPPGEPHRAWSLVVLELDGARIAAMTHFLDTATLFPRFGVPLTLRERPAVASGRLMQKGSDS